MPAVIPAIGAAFSAVSTFAASSALAGFLVNTVSSIAMSALATAIQGKLAGKGGLNMVGIPKTIDNDLMWIERSFGFLTDVEIARTAIAAAHAEAQGGRGGPLAGGHHLARTAQPCTILLALMADECKRHGALLLPLLI